MVVLALILNKLFLLVSHPLPVDPVYLFRHRITLWQSIQRLPNKLFTLCNYSTPSR